MDVTELTALIRKTPEMLAKTRNVGLTGAWDDLYTVVDFLSYAFGQTYPTLPCRAGCFHCCDETPFRVSGAEWRAIALFLASEVDEAAREALKASVRAVYGPHRAQLEALASFWSTTELGTEGAPMEGLPTRCPFLSEAGACNAYEVRPLVCRAYGNFGATIAGKPTMLICKPYGPAFIQGLAQSAAETLTAPPVEPFYQRLEELAPGSPVAPLALWALRWADESES